MSADILAGLAREYHDLRCTAQPLLTSFFGAPGYEAAMPDLSEEREASVAAGLRDIAQRTASVDATALDANDRVTRAVLLHETKALAEQLEDRHQEFGVYGPFSPIAQLFLVLPKADDLDAHEARLRATPDFLRQLGDRALQGVRSGRGPQERGLRNVVEQLRAYLAMSLDTDPFLGPAAGRPTYERLRAIVADQVRPAAQSLLDVLSGEVTDRARGDEQAGLIHLTDGEVVYRRALASHTTTERSPEDIHATGVALIAELRQEFAQLGSSVFGTHGFDEVIDRLRRDTGLRYASPQEMLADAQEFLSRAEQAVPQWFGTYHRAPCGVEPMSEFEAPNGVPGRYIPAATDGSAPGFHAVNTYQPHTRPKYEYEALAFHESVPGHHLQFAVGQELTDVPEFRRFGYVTAFSEGWALYTERLCDEMGLYSSDLARFGMVCFDSWRASRLVVDTGMHHFGWSRQRAIDYMWANTAMTRQNIVNEVDRYIAWPGQACSYMVGRTEINELRAEAQRRQGPSFDIRAFHDAVLLNGGIPLTVLRDEVTRALS